MKGWFSILIMILFIIAGCVNKEKFEKLNVSVGFEKFPEKYTCDGNDISPRISINGIKNNIKSIAIMLIDSDARNFAHWLIWNIVPKSSILVIPENISKKGEVTNPIKAIQGRNDFGKIGYNGPCPPHGKHHYHFKVYGLDTTLNLSAGSTKWQLEKAMKGHIIQYGEAVATYER